MKLVPRVALVVALSALVSVPAGAAPRARATRSKTAHAARPTAAPEAKPGAAPKAARQAVPAQPMRLKRGKPLLNFEEGVTTYSGEPPVPGMGKATAKSTKMRRVELPRLDRGEKAVLTAEHPAAEGVGLIGMWATIYQSIPMFGTKAGIYFHGEQSSPNGLQAGAGFILDPSTLEGDDLAVTCRGDFPSSVTISVLRNRGSFAGQLVRQIVPVSSGKAKFFVSSASGEWTGMVVVLSAETAGVFRLGQCTVERDPD